MAWGMLLQYLKTFGSGIGNETSGTDIGYAATRQSTCSQRCERERDHRFVDGARSAYATATGCPKCGVLRAHKSADMGFWCDSEHQGSGAFSESNFLGQSAGGCTGQVRRGKCCPYKWSGSVSREGGAVLCAPHKCYTNYLSAAVDHAADSISFFACCATYILKCMSVCLPTLYVPYHLHVCPHMLCQSRSP
eukprot:1847020-Rhodomonas_salina.5